MPKVAAPVTDLDALPVILTIQEIATIYRLSESTIRRGVQRGTFSPRPCRRYPYRWRREDVISDVGRVPGPLPPTKHGYATTRPRAAKARLDGDATAAR